MGQFNFFPCRNYPTKLKGNDNKNFAHNLTISTAMTLLIIKENNPQKTYNFKYVCTYNTCLQITTVGKLRPVLRMLILIIMRD